MVKRQPSLAKKFIIPLSANLAIVIVMALLFLCFVSFAIYMYNMTESEDSGNKIAPMKPNMQDSVYEPMVNDQLPQDDQLKNIGDGSDGIDQIKSLIEDLKQSKDREVGLIRDSLSLN